MSFISKLHKIIAILIIISNAAFAQNVPNTVNGISYPTQVSGNYESFCAHEYSRLGVIDQRSYRMCLNGSIDAYQEIMYLIKTTPKNSYSYNFLQNIINQILADNLHVNRFGRNERGINIALKNAMDDANEIEFLFQTKSNGKLVFNNCKQQNLSNANNPRHWIYSIFSCMKNKL
jgi:hypothetical protein